MFIMYVSLAPKSALNFDVNISQKTFVFKLVFEQIFIGYSHTQQGDLTSGDRKFLLKCVVFQ